ncbi:MAG TPA: hypothetical protein VFH51_02630, partial [Myxococcota bacterium]|nr:hypothetical protein [Myxococcota bacterium]
MLTQSTRRVLYADRDFCLGDWRNVMLMMWGGEMRLEHLAAIRECQAQMNRAYPGSVGIVLFTQTMKLPGREVRKASEMIGRELTPISLGAAHVVEGDGLKVATLRTVLSAILLASRQRGPSRVFNRLDDAVPWLQAQPNVVAGGPETTPSLLDAATVLRRTF